MMKKRLHGLLTGMLLVMTMAASAAEARIDPQQVVRETAEKVLAEVTARKTELEADPSQLYSLVKDTVVPHFDFTAMTRSVMGRFWRRATEQQKRRLVAEFQEMLVRTYATALLGYSGQTIEYPTGRYPEDASKVVVSTRIRAAGGPPIPIDYRLKWDEKRGEWLVYDVVIDSVSLVTNYRSSFARLIREGARKAKNPAQRMQVGIDHLIATLSAKNDASGQKKEQSAG
ncbi:MlaC/ttg2D family ABC transporter substrate-binding protein [endosymbiont of unidentified scaly snail isolate Monju]|uniref:MlaC/ttg2D family ABC transporter substrate-binding protein n=1 Tax=endosymbiont of unidentified scaly snail isolate Monju TaxID=1248727 RepID=UPI0003891A97|nr:ABC transporter substrate-binding protein [endosymbiont of unidentified scaly snail isolate Monju]BAN70066.1 toluene tolerance protein [endosymbiont of unidentified scaly snail isolate Monju]